MAGQRNRIWITRIAIIAVVAGLLAIGANTAWKQLTRSPAPPNGAASSRVNEPVNYESEQNDAPVLDSDALKSHPLAPVLEMAREALARHRAENTGYTATMLKTERIDGKLSPQATMKLKLRYLPPDEGSELRNVAVYLDFIAPSSQKGREVIFQHGKNDNLLQAHEGGFFGLITVSLAPNSRIAMMGNRYPITDVGLEKLLVRLIEKGERDLKLGDCTVNRRSGEMVGDKSCELIEVIHNEKSVTIGDKVIPYEFHIARIWFDESIMLPIKYASYGWPDEVDGEPLLEEEYQYDDLVLNPPLTDLDFDVENPEYRFR
ncbi:DUF1571 domain-containing protein [Pirellulaceae bacterium SH449]